MVKLILLKHQMNNVRYEFDKELYIGERSLGNKNLRDNCPIIILQSPAIMKSGIPTNFSPRKS